MKTIIVAGGTGLLGKLATTHFLEKGWQVKILSRTPQTSKVENLSYLVWDGEQLGDWTSELNGANVLLNLSGRTVDCRYTERNKQQIMQSRLRSTRILNEAVGKCEQPPRLWLNASSATYYTHAYTPQTETDGRVGKGFSVEVCQRWEQEFYQTDIPTVRKVALRLGFVLSERDSALTPLKNMAMLGITALGPGTQYMSWLHEQDYLRSLDFIIEKETISGSVNLCSPRPVTNRDFMRALRRAVPHLPIRLSLPQPILELGARLIKTETELILKSRYVVPESLLNAGFEFSFNTIEKTLAHLVTSNKSLCYNPLQLQSELV